MAKETMKAKIERLESEKIIATNERELLWEALETLTKALEDPTKDSVKELALAKKFVADMARCNCGRKASMYGHNGYGRICETCLST